MYLPPISQVVSAAANGLRDIAREPGTHPAHVYIGERLGVQPTLCERLRALSPAEFEDLLHPVFKEDDPEPACISLPMCLPCISQDLLHPVFKEDEIILIIVGGVLGAAAGLMQMRFGWGGPAAVRQGSARALAHASSRRT
jgi:hypothetical protein